MTNMVRIKRIEYTYATRQRRSKKVTKHNSVVVDYTWYIRDASGDMLNMYSYSGNSTVAAPLAAQNLIQNEAYLFVSIYDLAFGCRRLSNRSHFFYSVIMFSMRYTQKN